MADENITVIVEEQPETIQVIVQEGSPGARGLSAYAVAVAGGYEGTEAQWLASLKGTNGNDGRSAYQVAVEDGYSGSEADWLLSLQGADGQPGADGSNGLSAYEIAIENGFVGTVQEWLASHKGEPGQDGQPGTDGQPGADGSNGASAYQVAVNNGFVGTEAEWLVSLKGATGNPGTDGTNGTNGDSAYTQAVANGFVGTIQEWLASLKGEPGTPGQPGADGADGDSAYAIAVGAGFSGTEAEWLASLKGATGDPGAAGPGLPAGGTAGQIPAKRDSTDYNTHWVDPPTGGGAVDSVNGQTGTVVLDAADVGAEPELGNPDADGKVLSSTAAGVRSWVAAGGSSFSPTITDVINKDILKYNIINGQWENQPDDGSVRSLIPHKGWRVFLNSNGSSGYNSLIEIQFRSEIDVAETPTGGFIVGSTDLTDPSKAFDGNVGTRYDFRQDTGPGYIYATAKIVKQIAIMPSSYWKMGASFILQYSDDGINWYNYTTYTSVGWTYDGNYQLFATADQSLQSKFIKAKIASPASGQYIKYNGADWVNGDAEYEPSLGNPDTDGKVLSSTAAGVRSWIAAGGGSSASDIILTDIYANRPAAGTAGRLFLPTDDNVVQRDNGSNWDTWLRGPKIKPVVLSDFTLINQGTATVAQQGAGIIFSDTKTSEGFACRILDKNAPATPYTLTVGFETMSVKVSSAGMLSGIVLRDSVTGRFVFWQTRLDSSVNIVARRSNYYSPTSFSDDGQPFATQKPHNYLRITNDGTNLSYGYSSDGKNFLTLETTGKAAFVANIDKIGMCIECYNARGITNFFHWEVT